MFIQILTERVQLNVLKLTPLQKSINCTLPTKGSKGIYMAKWTKKSFIEALKQECKPHEVNVSMDFIQFSEAQADIVAWGRGEGYGTMTFKVKSEDWGIVPIFHITSDGKIKFLLNYMRKKVRKREILKEYTLKLESNFMMDFNEDVYNADIYFEIGELFVTKTEVDKLMHTVKGITARLHQ